MNENLFSIGEISKIKGITIKALRFYEKIGLIKPHYTDPSTRFRYYSLEQFIHLDIIKAARSMDISPKDVKVILEKKDNKVLLDFMNYQKESAALKIAELQKMISIIDATQNTINNSVSSISQQDIFFKDIPLRYIISKKFDDFTKKKDLLIEYSKFQKIIEDDMLIDNYETGIICTSNDKNEFHPSEIYNGVNVISKSNKSRLSEIQAGRYLCICYNEHNAEEQLSKLYRYINQNKLKPSLMIQVDLLNNVFETETQYVEMQVIVNNDEI